MSLENPAVQPPSPEFIKLQQEVRAELEKILDRYPDPEERRKHFEEKFAFFSEADPSVRAAVQTVVEASVLQDRDAYIQTMMSAMEPLFRFKIEHASSYEELEARRRRHVAYDYDLLTELLGYGFDNNGWMRLHIPENKGKDPMELYRLMRESMNTLAAYLEGHPEVPGVVGASWIAADKHGARLLERLGFIHEGLVDEDLRAARFADEERPVASVRMTRDQVIERYGRSEKRK